MEEDNIIFNYSYGKLYRVVIYASDVTDELYGFTGMLVEYTGSHLLFELSDGSINVICASCIHHMIRRCEND